ncbi:natural killer cells antigen CD94-like, partial [Emydura macquarii macquarii]|uniref:natural killer cells antigen CD94-like n=1 Tax=Emydura macquarii macquarii TaxID=1129001 RepID=UPI00352AED9E
MSEQSVTYVDLRFHTPAEQKRKRRPEHTRVTEISKQEITYSDLKFHTPSKQQRQQTPTSAKGKESPSSSSPWLITMILGLFCLALLATTGVLGDKYLQASEEVKRLELTHNEESIHKWDILKNQSQLQETLKNCTQERDDLQAQISNISKVANTKGDKCSSCPESWIQHRGQCYHFTNERTTWEKSKEYCSSHGSRLLKIENKEELDFINPLVCYHWIGLSRKGTATDWKWEDGTAHYTDLFRVRTRDAGGLCALMNVGEAFSSECTGQYRPICEKRAAS